MISSVNQTKLEFEAIILEYKIAMINAKDERKIINAVFVLQWI